MITTPKVEQRAEQQYVGIRSRVPMSDLGRFIPQSLDQVFPWLGTQGIEPDGPPFIRYHVIDMAGLMDVEVGVPVAGAVQGDDQIKPGVIPAGRYASLIYTGIDGIPANGVLLDWGKQQGLTWDQWDDPHGDAFRSRVEFFLTEPDEEPDQGKWETEVMIKLAEA